MAAITAAMVKELRERTGLGMMECKKALVEAEGSVDAAIEELRKSSGLKAAKKAGRTALAYNIAFLQWPRKHDERQYRIRRWFEPNDIGTKVREILGARWFQLTGWTHFISRVAGHHLIDGSGMVE